MNIEKALDLIFGDDLPILQKQAKRAGVSVVTYLTQAVLPEKDTDLTPRQAAIELNVSPHTAKRYFHQGKFPNAYSLNPRVIRIPLKDIRDLKDSRRLSID